MMFDLPLHPIAVHFPIALGALIPLIALVVLWATRSNKLPDTTWYIVILLSALYFGSALLAAELGERDEDVVENVVKEQFIENHEESGERVPWAAGFVLLASLLPLVAQKKTKLQLATVVISSVALIPLIDAGHTGGQLVYEHGAARAHTEKNNQGKSLDANSPKRESSDDL